VLRNFHFPPLPYTFDAHCEKRLDRLACRARMIAAQAIVLFDFTKKRLIADGTRRPRGA
jgi:hypothetical protein